MNTIKNILLPPTATILEAIRLLDATAMKIVLVVDQSGRLVGTVSDGDVRRGILKNVALDRPVKDIMNSKPLTCSSSLSSEAVLQIMNSKRLFQIPVLDEDGRPIRLQVLDELLKQTKKENPIVLMAGGKGTRLYPLTEACPKPLLKVGDKPILERILEDFVEQGFYRFYISVHYKAQMIIDYFGDGSKWNAQIEYLHEETELGTAGALGLLPMKPDKPIILMNGDLLTQINFLRLLEFHEEHKSKATMCIKHYEFQVPYGVVQVKDHKLTGIDEKPTQRFFVNAGIYVFEPSVLDLVQPGERRDVTELFKLIADQSGLTSVFPIRESWRDIGQLNDFEEANKVGEET